MEPGKMATQMISFQKTVFDNNFMAMAMVLDQTEQLTNTFMNQFPWVPEEGKKAVAESIRFYKKAREDFKKAVEEGFSRMEDMLAGK